MKINASWEWTRGQYLHEFVMRDFDNLFEEVNRTIKLMDYPGIALAIFQTL